MGNISVMAKFVLNSGSSRPRRKVVSPSLLVRFLTLTFCSLLLLIFGVCFQLYPPQIYPCCLLLAVRVFALLMLLLSVAVVAVSVTFVYGLVLVFVLIVPSVLVVAVSTAAVSAAAAAVVGYCAYFVFCFCRRLFVPAPPWLRMKVADNTGAAELVNADVGGISFEDVHFGYTPDRKILKGLTFEVTMGDIEKTIAAAIKIRI